eukprot:TRINITY_DN16208_c0_g1_i1.p1 TRINITY_DN16208_c0_g1~~TRINITY_DN16208_c0_g1_i1.p1  ORF type:complete len:495 (+),score=75.07 TRINITY_DN16208_c0_g1_i1:28-1485(+)
MEALIQGMAAVGCFCFPLYQSATDYIDMEAESKRDGNRYDFEREVTHRRWMVYWFLTCAMIAAERLLVWIFVLKAAKLALPFVRCAATLWLLSPFTSGINYVLRYIEYVNIDVDFNSDFILGHNPAVVDLLRLLKDSLRSGTFDFILIPITEKVTDTFNRVVAYLKSVRMLTKLSSIFSMRNKKVSMKADIKASPKRSRKRAGTITEIDRLAMEKAQLTSPLVSPLTPALEPLQSQLEEMHHLKVKTELLTEKVVEYEETISKLEGQKEQFQKDCNHTAERVMAEAKKEAIEERRKRLEAEKHNLEVKEELQELATLRIRCEEQRQEIEALTAILGSKAYRAVKADKQTPTMITNSNKSVLIRSNSCTTTKTVDRSVPGRYSSSLTVFSSTNPELNGNYVRTSPDESCWLYSDNVLTFSHADRWVLKVPVAITAVTPRGHSASVLVNGTWCACTVFNFSSSSALSTSSLLRNRRSTSRSNSSARP